MSDRAPFRGGGRAGGRGGGESSHRGSRGGGGRGGEHVAHQPGKVRKENILELAKYIGKQISVEFNGGRRVIGTLEGYDQLMNLVLDKVIEIMQDDDGNETSRPLGLIVARGTLIVHIYPLDGSEEIENPF